MDNIINNEIHYINIVDGIRYIELNIDFPLYKSILERYDRNSFFTYKLSEDIIQNCQSIAWFAGKNKAEYYKRKNTIIHQYKVKKPAFIFVANNYNNYNFLKNILSTFEDVDSLRCITELTIDDIPSEIRGKFLKYDYLTMSKKQRVLFEYCFAFGLISLKEQFMFFKLMLKLQEYNIISRLNTMMSLTKEEIHPIFLRLFRQGLNILDTFFPESSKEYNFGNRFSAYSIDINVVQNLCQLLPVNFNGYIYLHQPSFWHRKMEDTSEIAIFNPIEILE